MLLNMLETPDIDHKVEAAVNMFLTRENIDVDASDLASKIMVCQG